MRMTYRQFLHSPQWQAFRLTILERDQRRCAICGHGPAEGAILDVHHLRQEWQGGDMLDPANNVTRCRRCHCGTHGKAFGYTRFTPGQLAFNFAPHESAMNAKRLGFK